MSRIAATGDPGGTVRYSRWPRSRRRLPRSKMKCRPALSRYCVSLKSMTSPADACSTALWSVRPSSLAFDMSISPRMRATGLPAWSSNWTSASIGVGAQGAPQLDRRAGLLAPQVDVVHQRLHQLQPPAPVLPARLAPRPVVTHRHDDVAVAARRLQVEAG